MGIYKNMGYNMVYITYNHNRSIVGYHNGSIMGLQYRIMIIRNNYQPQWEYYENCNIGQRAKNLRIWGTELNFSQQKLGL